MQRALPRQNSPLVMSKYGGWAPDGAPEAMPAPGATPPLAPGLDGTLGGLQMAPQGPAPPPPGAPMLQPQGAPMGELAPALQSPPPGNWQGAVMGALAQGMPMKAQAAPAPGAPPMRPGGAPLMRRRPMMRPGMGTLGALAAAPPMAPSY